MAEIRHFIPIRATPAKVFDALNSSAGLRSWWTADATLEPKVGGAAVLGFDDRAAVFRMKVEELERERRVVWSCHGDEPSWTGTRLVWEIEPGDGGVTHLRFVQSGLRALDDYWAGCNSTWGELMFRLRDHLEGKSPGPHWMR
jgi:uncharacterized protein YndB with AHSA1/START domain